LPRLEQAVAVTRAYGDRWGQACNLHVLGQLHLSEKQLDLAASCFDAAMSIWDALETPLWRARTRYAHSQVYIAQGETEAARAALAEALEVFHDRGAREYVEIIGN
jgi:predicted negative regulator of RcsB-dependent stress response